MLMRTPPRWARPKRPPGFIVPCQPILARTVPAGDGWLHEMKHDGFRILAFKDGERVRLWSRNGRDWSADLLAITAAVMALPVTRIVLDGGAVAHCLSRARAMTMAPLPTVGSLARWNPRVLMIAS
jgi:ATP-dependent DNA ligase